MIDLFSGAGGLGLGFEQAGFSVVAAVEYDPVHSATHRFNFPQTPVLCRDVSKLTAEEVLLAAREGFALQFPGRDFPAQIDAIIGGPPCQGFSTGGKRTDGDERNNLILEYVRLVEEIRPKTFCLENVAGLLEAKFSEVRNIAIMRLQAAGYALSGTTRAINAVDYGVPQNRKRVIILGVLGSHAPDVPEPTVTPEDYVSVGAALEGLPEVSNYSELLVSDHVELNARDLRLRGEADSKYARNLAGQRRRPDDFSAIRVWDFRFHTGGRRTRHTSETLERFSSTAQGSVEPKSRLYRLPSEGPSRTLRAGTGSERGAHTSPRPIHPTFDRVVTVREAARLHSYPDWFRFHVTNWHGHRQIGNSVPPLLAEAAGRSLIRSLEIVPYPNEMLVPQGPESLLSLSRSTAASIVGAVMDELPGKRRRVANAQISTAE